MGSSAPRVKPRRCERPHGEALRLLVPGIRLEGGAAQDQVRTATPAEAVAAGASLPGAGARRDRGRRPARGNASRQGDDLVRRTAALVGLLLAAQDPTPDMNRLRASWSRHDAVGVVAGGSRVVVQLPGEPATAPLGTRTGRARSLSRVRRCHRGGPRSGHGSDPRPRDRLCRDAEAVSGPGIGRDGGAACVRRVSPRGRPVASGRAPNRRRRTLIHGTGSLASSHCAGYA